jgi:DNA-binding MarR family transcriptional regulator
MWEPRHLGVSLSSYVPSARFEPPPRLTSTTLWWWYLGAWRLCGCGSKDANWWGDKRQRSERRAVTFLLITVVRTIIFTRAMAKRLREEIQQPKPFESLEQEAVLNMLRTADVLLQRIAAVLKPFNLSHSQYNVLRILRGAGPEGLACREIGERMITRDPDITRLLDRLEARGLLTRTRDQRDRRVITARITSEGRSLVDALDQPIAEIDRQPLQHLGEQRLRTLIQLLELARGGG